nr:Zgc:136346 [Danio rerio]
MEAIKTEVHPLDDAEQDESEESSPKTTSKPKVKMFELEIVEGKREKKVIQRLDMMSKPKEKPKIESKGRGDKLGDIARINHSIGKLKAPLLKPLHKILYDRPGAASTLRKNLRLFNGFPFKEDSDLYNKKMEKVKRLPKKLLKTICQTLDLERSGTQVVLSERIMKFLAQPTNSGKPVLKKKRKTTKDGKKEKSSSKSKKPQKKVVSGKSKPIVTDSSSDDDDDDDDDDDGDEEETKGKSKGTEKSAKASQKHDDSEDKSDIEEEDESSDDDVDDDDDSKEDSKEETSPPQKKSSTGKSTKKSDKMSDQSPSDETTDDSDTYCEDKDAKKTKKKPAAKRKAPAKPVPKTKKADSSSNRKKKTASKRKDESESSDDDQPLIKMIKKPPTDEQLKENVKDLLKDANLEEVTMKQITRQVYDKYPDFDLSSRKEFIRETVKNMIS